MSQTDEEETSEFGSYVIDQESFGSEHSVLASKLALLAASSGHSSSVEGNSEDQIPVDAETQARLEALLEAAGIGKLSTPDGKAFADPEVLRRLSSSVSCALDEAAAALSKMKTEQDNSNEQNQRTLVEACNEGDVNTVRRLLFEGHNANEATEDGESLLALACAAGYYELVEVLLTMHANIDDTGPKGECTPLMEAASGGYVDIVRLLLSHGADINARSSTGNTALTYACCGGFEEIVKVFVENGAELESHNENGHTPLMEAASNGHVSVAAILLQHGAGINTHSNEFKESALTLACYKGHLQMVRFLLQAGADQEHKTDEMHTALMEASMDGHVEVARLLLDSGAQVNMPADSFESPLTLAACGGHVDLAELLIQRGAAIEEVNDEGYTPLMEAAREGHEEMVTLLLKKGAKVNTKTEETQETALTLSCCGGFIECVEVLLKAGADVEAGSSTPIMEASQEGHYDLVKYLHEEAKANVNAVNNNGETALSFACEHGHTKVAEFLLTKGAELEHETDGGRTPLMKASRGGHLCTVQFLLSKGADVNRATKNNEHTPLSLACVCGHLSVVELLLCHGADPNFKLKDGSNLLLEASKGGHVNVVQFLLDLPNFYALSSDNSLVHMVPSTSPDQMAPRVPTQSLPMVVPPHEPDQAPDFAAPPGCEHYPPASLLHLSNQLEGKLPQDTEKANHQLHALYQQQLQYYQQQNPTANRTEASFNTAALVSHLLQQGSLPGSSSEPPVVSDQKQAVDKDVAVTVESFLRSMANDAAGGKLRTAESIVEEAKGKLSELEQRIKEAIEKNAQLKSVEMMQTDQLTKEKVEEIYKTREEQIHKKQKILEELQKVERELQLKTQQQLKEHYLDMKQGEAGSSSSHRGNPDGENEEEKEQNESVDDVIAKEAAVVAKTEASPKHETLKALPPDTKILESYRVEENPALIRYDPNLKLNNGASGSFPQPVKNVEDSFCQCVHHSCPQLSHPPDEVAPTFMPPSPNYPTLEIESHTESNHDTPLTLAAAGGHDELVHLLLSRGANIEHRDKKGFTPLILAATAGHANVVATLLDTNADIEALSDRTKDTPLSLACSGGRLEAAEMLLQRGANKEHRNVSDYTPLSLAASGGFVSVVKLLLHHGAEINSRTGSKLGISPLMLAAMNGHYESVQLLLDMGADINAQIETNRNTALTLACFQGRHNVVSLLVDRKANVEHRAKTGLTPLMEAASGGYAEVGRVLLDKGADPNAPPVPSSRDTALTIAADKGHYRFCELILSRNAQVEVKNKKGNTPLWLACNGGHLDVVMLLVGKGASVNACDNRGVSPLMAAFRKGHVQVVRWLAKEVSQFPSDSECVRYVATVSDKELLKRTQQCMECIAEAKALQAQEANKFASELLEEVSNQKSVVKDRKSKNAKRREKRRRKKIIQSPDEDKNDDEDYKDDEDHVDDDDPVDEVTSQTSKLAIDDTARFAAESNVTSAPPKTSVETQTAPSPPVMTTISTAPNSRVNVSAPKTAVNTSQSVVTIEERVAIHPLIVSRPVRSKSPEPKKKISSVTTETYVASSGVESSPRSSLRKSRKVSSSTKNTMQHSREQPSSRASLRVSSATYSSSARSTTTRKPQRKEEGWKEVTKKYGTTSGMKRMMIASNLISRVIGRGGCNINAIREITAAHIDIDKLKKGTIERIVTIKGSIESITHAQNLITALIEEEKTEHEIAEFIAKAQAEAAEQRAAQNKPAPPKPTLTVIAAPIPSKPAWTVPPSIVAQSSRQTTNQPNNNSTFKVGVWTPPTVEKSSATTTTSSTNKWQTTSSGVQVTTSPPTVETVKKALFHSSHTASTATTTVTFSRQFDKPVSKPVQPVAPMMATKTTASPPTRILQSTYGPIGSGIPRSQPQPIQRPNPPMEPTEENPMRAAELGNPNATMPRPMQGPAMNGMMNQSQSAAPQHASMISISSAVSPQNQTLSHSVSANHSEMMQNQMYRPSLSSVPTPIGMTAEGTPRSSVGVTPVRGINNNFQNATAEEKAFTHQSIRSPTYSPFSSSFTPSAGSSALWNNGSNPVAPFKVPPSIAAEEKNEEESPRSMVDQSKAPGYRGITKSPNMVEDSAAAAAASGNQQSNMETNSTSSGSQQGSPCADGEASAKPRPIGTERAQLQRKTNPSAPLVGRSSASIWSYDKISPAQLGMDSIEPGKFNNWSAVIGPARNEGIITTATSSKPQVTPTEMSASSKPQSAESPAQNPRLPVMINQLYPPGASPHLLYGNQGRMQANTGRFPPQATATGRVPGTQAPIGSQMGANTGVGIVGVQQQQPQHSVLQPIGSHLGGAGHLRGNVNFHQNQMPRNMGSNPGHPQQASQNHRFQLSYYHDMAWQQQQPQQQQQHSVYNNPPSRHPAINPYQQRDPQHSNTIYSSLHSPYSNNIPGNNINQNPVLQGYSNPPMPEVNPAYPIHPESQTPYVRDGGQYFDGNNEFLFRNMVPNNYGNPPADGNPNWDPSLCRPGNYQSMNGVPDTQSAIRSQHGVEMESQQVSRHCAGVGPRVQDANFF